MLFITSQEHFLEASSCTDLIWGEQNPVLCVLKLSDDCLGSKFRISHFYWLGANLSNNFVGKIVPFKVGRLLVLRAETHHHSMLIESTNAFLRKEDIGTLYLV
ncbi:mCG147014 [Mus musculus]|jgi:hypothetical protein|uniref:Uncharacterized protein n=1 Tax=Mus musculus TaxID=10090 RepID=Q9D5G8_MOUSE|nr:mCG147014 [Mus musculus]BAB29812.1 unnamed protein product [Mus musculus]